MTKWIRLQTGFPLMMVQPEKDYQVTVDDDLAIWKKRLEERARRM
jgi:hypothetical protein